jgi:amino acid adenylation domain-containing protein
VNLLEAAAEFPEQKLFKLPILDPADRHKVLVSWNSTAAPYPADRPLHHLIEEQVARTATAVAVESGEFCLTYGQLNQQANRLAQYLRERGVKANEPVAICMKRSPDLAVAMLATLKAGGLYVPIDPNYPGERVKYMLEDCQARIVLTQSTENLPASAQISDVFCMDRDWEQVATREDGDLACDVVGQDLAYIIYTSGSTGAPKGTEITHSALVNFLYSMQQQPGLKASDILFSVTSPSFDIFGLELWLPLLVGARVVLASQEEVVDGAQLCKGLMKSQATVMQATPATWRMLLVAGAPISRSLKALCGGETLPADLAVDLLSRGIELWNMYGPTETTVWSTIEPIKDTRERITIGRPVANTAAYVLDSNMQPVPIGVTGELFLAGAGVARGYFRRPELTEEKFLSDPFGTFAAGRMYRTGDLARFLADGRLECLGRTDHQIKIRGYRIEPGEIEARLAAHPQLAQAVVVLRQDRNQNQRLIAYIVACDGQSVPATVELQRFLRERLPDYMIPSAFVALPSLPLTPNGKVDRKALPAPHQNDPVAVGSANPAVNQCLTPQESILTDLWKELLDVSSILPTDDFFALGGHSLLAARMFSRLEQQYRRPLPVALLFRSPTIRTLAREIDNYPPTVEGPKIFTFRANGQKPPLILMPSLDGSVLMWRDLVLQLPDDRPVGGVYLAGDSMFAENLRMADLARLIAVEIVEHYPNGPYHLAGYSFGGMLAFEVAVQIKALGKEVGILTVMDIGPEQMHVGSALEVLYYSGQIATNILIRSWDALRNERWSKLVSLVFRRLNLLWRYWFTRKDNPTSDYDMAYEYLFAGVDLPERLHQRITVNLRRGIGFKPGKYAGNLLLLRSTKRSMFGPFQRDLGWGEHVAGKVDVVALKGAHNDVIDLQQLQAVSGILSETFATYDEENGPTQPPKTLRFTPESTVHRKAR